MSLDYALRNPLPVTLADGSVIEVTNLGDIEAILTAIGLNSDTITAILEGNQKTTPSGPATNVTDKEALSVAVETNVARMGVMS